MDESESEAETETETEIEIDPDADAVRRLEDERVDALVAGDVDAFARLCHPDLVYTHSNAVVDTLDAYVAKLRAGFYAYHSIDHPITTITVHGDTALVIGAMHASITADGVAKVLHNRTLAVWLRDDGAWRFAAFQPTPIPEVA